MPAVFAGKPCTVVDASCDLDKGTVWNTNLTLLEPDSSTYVRVIGNFLPCVASGGFRLKARLHLNSFGVLTDAFCVGDCCSAADLDGSG